MDLDGQLYIADEFELNNYSGVTSMGAMGGMMGEMTNNGFGGMQRNNASFGGQMNGRMGR